MSEQHPFIFQPGQWIGEGAVSFSSSTQQVFFVTKWRVGPASDEGIHCAQEVKMEGAEEPVNNHFLLCNITSNSFDISLENEIVERVEGSGIIDSKTIGWEFRDRGGSQGYEVYELHNDGEYSFHAEYIYPRQFRTIINGRIRKQER